MPEPRPRHHSTERQVEPLDVPPTGVFGTEFILLRHRVAQRRPTGHHPLPPSGSVGADGVRCRAATGRVQATGLTNREDITMGRDTGPESGAKGAVEEVRAK